MTPEGPLFDGVRLAVNDLLKGSYKNLHQHRGLGIEFLEKAPKAELGAQVARAVVGQVEKKFQPILQNFLRSGRQISPENWRMAAPNKKPGTRSEVSLERAIVRASGGSRWWNQVPIASGLIDEHAYKTCAIDLVRRRGAQAFDFIELKVRSNTPLYAAVEIMKYGAVWLVSRGHRKLRPVQDETLLDARDVCLCVLAPDHLYLQRIDVLRAFERGASEALAEIGRRFGVGLSFRFEEFQSGFEWPAAFDPTFLPASLSEGAERRLTS